MTQKTIYANLCLLFVAFIWGFNPPVMKLGLQDLTPMLYNALRMFIAAVAAGVLLFATHSYKRFTSSDLWKLAKCSLIGYGAFQLLLVLGLRYTSSTNSALIFSLLPVSVFLINRFSKNEQTSKAVLIGIAVSFAGVVLIIISTGQGLNLANSDLLGAVLLLIGQAFYGYYTVFSKEMLAKYSVYQISFFVILFTSLLFFLLSLPELWTATYNQITARSLFSALFSGVLPVCMGNFFWIWGTTIIGSTRTAIYSNVSPIFAALGGYLLLGENVTLLQIIGGIIIFAGLYLTKDSPRPKQSTVSKYNDLKQTSS